MTIVELACFYALAFALALDMAATVHP